MTSVAAPPPTVSDVAERLRAVLVPLDRDDGVACFARLYLAVTEQVQAELAVTFADPGFLTDLDVRFAELFFAAMEDRGRPAAWEPLFEARHRKGIAPIQFALAGMNAHINRDLPVAIVASCERAGIQPEDATPQHADYRRVNTVLADVELALKKQYVGGVLGVLAKLLHRVRRLDDTIAMWDVVKAREAAWTNAEVLWSLRDAPVLYGRYLETLDRSVGLAGRGLLVPADSWPARLVRAVT
ncbi:MAG TPA: DUF5995 family protein [Gaiellaceae bacterium]|nr:DUF5995 family protein [Gaiellaceae bacterium]